MKENQIVDKSTEFALRIIRLYKFLKDEKKEFVLSKQILRSGTSIGANVREAQCAQSKADFIAKMYIAYKEAAETEYWLELLYKSDFLDETQYKSINDDCVELCKILSTITRKNKV